MLLLHLPLAVSLHLTLIESCSLQLCVPAVLLLHCSSDLILLPVHVYFGVDDVDTTTNLTKNIQLRVPFISSPMDTVTESEMAIQMALHGGIGIMHYNNTIKEQRKLIDRVKNFKNGFIMSPKTLAPSQTLQDVLDIKQRYGFTGIPITEDGNIGSRLVGLITNRDIDFCKVTRSFFSSHGSMRFLACRCTHLGLMLRMCRRSFPHQLRI